MMQSEYHFCVVVADDHDAFRNSLKKILQRISDVRIIGEAVDGLNLIEFLKIQPHIPDMAIIDVSMPILGGFEAASIISRTYPDMKILLLSMHKEKEYVIKGFSVGANGYLTKENVHTELPLAIEEIRKGGIYFPSLPPDQHSF